ncbi:MAG: hypothetical protein JNM02_09960 [Anaerolineales bacterium]|nr:hypothetical protein [Anaerolineales bacterium]
MGHKGVSKRKPKKTNAVSNENVSNFVKTPSKEKSPVQSLVKNNGTSPQSGDLNPAGLSRKNKKGK